MNVWALIAIQVVSAFLIAALTSKPKGPEVQQADLPVAEDGAPVPVIFGDVWIEDSNILWFGDQDQTPIKRKANKK